MMAKLEEITPAAEVGNCGECAIGHGFKRSFQLVHDVKATQEISVPKCKTVREKECKFKWKVGPHDFKSEMGVEVNQNRSRQNGRWPRSWIEANYRCPTNFLNEPLLKLAPAFAYVPTQPWAFHASERLTPLPSCLVHRFQRNPEPRPIPFTRLGGIHRLFLLGHSVTVPFRFQERRFWCNCLKFRL